MAFWQVVLLFSLSGALFVVWPLFKISFTRKSSESGVEYDQTQVELYREHLADLEKSLAAGDVDDTQFAELKIELQRTLIAEGAVATKAKVNHGGKKIILACTIVVPILSFILYQQWGAEKDWDIYQLIQQLKTTETQTEYDNKLRELVVDVQHRLKQKPDDIQLRNLLGQMSMNLQDYDQAVNAYEIILKAHPESARIIANLAQALFYRAGNVVTEDVRKYTHKALALAPMLPEMLGLAGIDAKNQGDYRAAIGYWKTAIKFMDPKSATARGYANGIANAEKALLAAGESLDESTAKAGHGTRDKEGGDASPAITLNVSLGDKVMVKGNETLYVYARAWKGAKVPLAIQKTSVDNLPITVILDESMAMAPGMTISKFPKLEVIARISQSGGPIAQSGDWQVSFGPVVLSELTDAIDLVISEQIP